MQLALNEAIRRSGGTELQFFQTAYMWAFKKVGNCVDDVCQWRLHAVVPVYVKKYLEHIFGG